jgi:hypothetical protein
VRVLPVWNRVKNLGLGESDDMLWTRFHDVFEIAKYMKM